MPEEFISPTVFKANVIVIVIMLLLLLSAESMAVLFQLRALSAQELLNRCTWLGEILHEHVPR